MPLCEISSRPEPVMPLTDAVPPVPVRMLPLLTNPLRLPPTTVPLLVPVARDALEIEPLLVTLLAETPDMVPLFSTARALMTPLPDRIAPPSTVTVPAAPVPALPISTIDVLSTETDEGLIPGAPPDSARPPSCALP